MKTTFTIHFFNVSAGVCALTLLTGCFETKDEFTVNPDGSGKVVHECTFQQLKLGGDTEVTEDSLKVAIGKVLTDAKGVEAWRDVSYQRLDDGRLFFKGTAYFTNLGAFLIPGQTMLGLDWQRSGTGAVLSLRTNQAEPKDGAKPKRKPVDWSRLSPEERAQKLREQRASFQQGKGVFTALLGGIKHETVFHLPGKVAESSNFTKDASGTLGLQFQGAKLLAAMEKLIADDAWATKNFDSLGGQERPVMDDEVNALLYGSKAPVRAAVTGGRPLFNYAAEVAVARKETEQLCAQLGLGTVPGVVVPPAQGGELQAVKLVGTRWVARLDRQETGFRPFHSGSGITVVLQVDFPGSILAPPSAVSVTKAIADDGSDLLPAHSWLRQTVGSQLSADGAAALLEVELKSPGPGVKGLRELSGTLEYQAARGLRSVDLGFTNLQANARGTALGAQIKSIKPGWQKDGSQQLELRLNQSKPALKAVYLKVNAVSLSKLRERSYQGGDGVSCTYVFDHTEAIPPNAQLVAEVYDQIQTFETTFKLENISLMGTPLDAK